VTAYSNPRSVPGTLRVCWLRPGRGNELFHVVGHFPEHGKTAIHALPFPRLCCKVLKALLSAESIARPSYRPGRVPSL